MIGINRTPKLLRSIVGIAIMLIAFTFIRNITEMRSLANNHTDTLFEYTVNTDTYQVTDIATPTRSKTDKSSAYIYNKNSTVTINYIRVHSNGKDMTQGIPKSCAVGQAKYLYNLVYENGYRNCYLVMEPANGFHAFISILWSPDSV